MATLDAVERGEERQDQVRDVPVDEREDDRRRAPAEPVAGLAEHVREHEEPVHVAVGLQQVHPGQHPHHVADPEREDDQDQDQALPSPGVSCRVVSDRVADEQAEGE